MHRLAVRAAATTALVLGLALAASGVATTAGGAATGPATAGAATVPADTTPSCDADCRAITAEGRALVDQPGGPPGAIVLVDRLGSTAVYSFGTSEVGVSVPITPTTHLRLASVSKMYSGAVALALVAAGELRLSDPVGRWVRNLPAAWRPVTLAELLQHTSGIPDFIRSPGFVDRHHGEPVRPAVALRPRPARLRREDGVPARDGLRVLQHRQRARGPHGPGRRPPLVRARARDARHRPARPGLDLAPADRGPPGPVRPRLSGGGGRRARRRHQRVLRRMVLGIRRHRVDAHRRRPVRPRLRPRITHHAHGARPPVQLPRPGRRSPRAPEPTRRAWPSSATGPRAAPSTATPATRSASPSSPPPRRTAHGRWWCRSMRRSRRRR